MNKLHLFNIYKGGIMMKKVLSKIFEMYAKATTNTCGAWLFHEPKAPRSLIRK